MLPLLVFLFLIKNVSGENCNNFTLPNGQLICVSSEGNKFSESKDTPLGEISASIPPGDKDGLYYFVISMFVVSTFTSTILTGSFLVLSIILWPHFKQMKFFWFLAQLTVSVFVMSSLNFLINVPATLFSLITLEIIMQFVIPILILIIYIALVLKILQMKKTTLNKYELTILKQAFFIFVLFQISSTVFLLCQTVYFEVATAFMIKRVINTAEIFAGAATPCFFFFTSKEIRKLISVKVSASSSQANSNNQQRRQTLRST
ncbi:unnamed protein product [Caenorhabditis brenneri]